MATRRRRERIPVLANAAARERSNAVSEGTLVEVDVYLQLRVSKVTDTYSYAVPPILYQIPPLFGGILGRILGAGGRLRNREGQERVKRCRRTPSHG